LKNAGLFTCNRFGRKSETDSQNTKPAQSHAGLPSIISPRGAWVGVRGVNSACAAWLFACETFAQEPIHHQLSLNLKLGWGGVHDCAGPPSLPARNPAENFGRDWWVVDVAVDRGAIRHDLFPKQSGLQRRPGSKGAIGWGSSQLAQRTLFLSTLSQRPGCDDPKEAPRAVTARAFYASPAAALLSKSLSDFAENSFCEVSEATGLKRSRANGGPVVRSHVDVPGSSSTKNKVAIWLGMRAHGAASLHEVRRATLPGLQSPGP
jgi:hypothetical protein